MRKRRRDDIRRVVWNGEQLESESIECEFNSYPLIVLSSNVFLYSLSEIPIFPDLL